MTVGSESRKNKEPTMKKFVALVAIMLLPVGANAAAAMEGSRHDFSVGSGNGAAATSADDRICVYCHVPHNSRQDINGIWNRSNGTQTTYAWGSTSPTIGGTTLGTTIGSGSLRCFSCHDGTLDIGSLLNGSYNVDGDSVNDATGLLTAAFYLVTPATMAGNHPVSVRYPSFDNTGTYLSGSSGAFTSSYVALATLTNNGVIPVYQDGANGYGIECGSCHEPHDTTYTYFLRDTLAGSQLCIDCHVK